MQIPRGDSYLVIIYRDDDKTEYAGPFQLARLAIAWTQRHLTDKEQFDIVPMDTPNVEDWDDRGGA